MNCIKTRTQETVRYCLSFTLAVLLFSSCNVKPSAEGKIVVDMARKGAEVPSSMYGVFFEEINHAGDGGLYAELVRNRSFEEKELPAGYHAEGDRLHPEPAKNHISGELSDQTYRWTTEDIPAWTLVSEGPGKATMKVTKAEPLSVNAPNSLQITIPANAGMVSLMNSGYWGMGLRKGEKYELRFFLKTKSYKGNLNARLLTPAGNMLDTAHTVLKSDGSWNEYRLVLEPALTEEKALLSLDLSGEGTLQVDFVSLFPENTFNNRPNGLRKDVAEFLAALHPAFIRWPGGCIVEGISLVNRVEWKKTLGDPAGRPGQYDTWGYRNTYGFGYHEFLQYCEDIGAGAMFVCNVGLGCQYRCADACKPGEVQYYVNDALDAVEYALGDTTTTWGARRAAAGHPQPFPLRYVEIGNENWGALYNERFEIFYKAIKARYPELTLISNHALKSDMSGITKTDMIDPHWYVEPGYFFSNDRIFDTIPRDKHLVYVGEYACNQKVGGGSMLAALSEAAFITGMERNSDLVRMASYAPLFENRNDRTWPVNLIWFDNLQVLGRSSYYVQKMFAENRPSWNIGAELSTGQAAGTDSLRQFLAAGFDEKAGEIVLKVVNATEKAWPAEIKLMNAGTITGKGKVISLSSKSLNDENSYDSPLLISPVESEYLKFSGNFVYNFNPNSLTVLRIAVK